MIGIRIAKKWVTHNQPFINQYPDQKANSTHKLPRIRILPPVVCIWSTGEVAIVYEHPLDPTCVAYDVECGEDEQDYEDR